MKKIIEKMINMKKYGYVYINLDPPDILEQKDEQEKLLAAHVNQQLMSSQSNEQ